MYLFKGWKFSSFFYFETNDCWFCTLWWPAPYGGLHLMVACMYRQNALLLCKEKAPCFWASICSWKRINIWTFR